MPYGPVTVFWWRQKIGVNFRARMRIAVLFALIAGGWCAVGRVAAADDASTPRFDRDIRPILSENCFRCHGPELKSRKAKLRLDVREVAVEKQAIVPGKPEDSEMIRRLTTSDPDDHMPPAEMHKVVTPAQIEVLRRWIAAGAKYEPHWSYAPLVRPALPPVADATWVQNPIDTFILARLEEAKIKPSPAADRHTLLRRLALDLTGLPPTPEEVEQFVNDRSPDAYAKQVDRLLASPHYGERMAVPWLDAVRFADTVGYHGDQDQNIFPYRDYVIDSFNHNKPFDQFTIEQLAGDLLPHPTEEQEIASGFNRLNLMTREGGAQPKEYLAKYAADRVRTVSTAWLGSTMACCQCHDHKYDPFKTKDFYSLGAFFDDVKQWGVYQDYAFSPNPEFAGGDYNDTFPPELVVTNRFLLRRYAALESELQQVLADTAGKLGGEQKQSFRDWEKNLRASLKTQPDGWSVDRQPQVRLLKTNSVTALAVGPDGTVIASGKPVDGETFEVRVRPPAGWLAAIRLELPPAATNHFSSLRVTNEFAEIRLAAAVVRTNGKPVRVAFLNSAATARRIMCFNGHEIPNVNDYWKLAARDATNLQSAVYLLDPPVLIGAGQTLKLNIQSGEIGSFRIATTALAAADPLQAGLGGDLRRAVTGFSTRSRRELLVNTWIRSTTNEPAAYARLKVLDPEIFACNHGRAPTLVTVSVTNRLVSRVLPRGNWQDESGEIVEPAVPQFLPQPPHHGTNLLTRLDLARWLVSPENPLTPRAFVNRLWKQLFGNGLSNQPEDLGTQGEYPSHPELIDWLAAEFRDSGWDVKHIVRLMVMSATYQQDSKIRPELHDLDPNNRLLARQNPRRLDAEFVRDNALAIAGLLDPEIGGPSVYPYQPAGYYANLQFPSRDYYASPGGDQYRRGLYTHWQRTFMHPMLANFDAPARDECTVDRPVSDTPQQALTLLNDPSFVEAARVFAEKIMTAPGAGDDAARINLAMETALLRPARSVEEESLLNFLAVQRSYYTTNSADAEKLLHVGQRPPSATLNPSEEAAWTTVARVVLNLHETITRY